MYWLECEEWPAIVIHSLNLIAHISYPNHQSFLFRHQPFAHFLSLEAVAQRCHQCFGDVIIGQSCDKKKRSLDPKDSPVEPPSGQSLMYIYIEVWTKYHVMCESWAARLMWMAFRPTKSCRMRRYSTGSSYSWPSLCIPNHPIQCPNSS